MQSISKVCKGPCIILKYQRIALLLLLLPPVVTAPIDANCYKLQLPIQCASLPLFLHSLIVLVVTPESESPAPISPSPISSSVLYLHRFVISSSTWLLSSCQESSFFSNPGELKMEPLQSRSSSSNLSELLDFFQPYKSTLVACLLAGRCINYI